MALDGLSGIVFLAACYSKLGHSNLVHYASHAHAPSKGSTAFTSTSWTAVHASVLFAIVTLECMIKEIGLAVQFQQRFLAFVLISTLAIFLAALTHLLGYSVNDVS